MLSFFRKIRLSLLSQNQMGKYAKYAIGEILLVVIGILIALAINNWNNERLKDNRDRELLSKLSAELDLNIQRSAFLDSLSTISGGFKGRVEFTDSLLDIMNRGIEPTDLDFMVSKPVYYVNTFNLNTSVFEELKNTGSLYALGSDSLVAAIQKYYQLCERESFYNLSVGEETKFLSRKIYDGWWNFDHLFETNPQDAIEENPWLFDKKSPEYIALRQFVESSGGHAKLMRRKLKGIIEESSQLKELIAQEIE